MAQDGRNPLTSVDIVRQNRGKIASTSAFKRPFEQISTVDSPVQFHQLVTSVPVIKNDFIRPSGERQALPLQPARLTASKVRKIPCAGTGDCNDVERAERLPAGSQPGSFLNPLLTLSHPRYGLPEILVKNFASLGVETIYPWQSSCLLGRGLLTGEKNLVYTAPTGGGKSLVADVLMLKKVLGSSYAKAILVLPYVALVQEKVNWLRKAVEGVQKDLQSPSQLAEAKRSGWHSSNTVRVVGFFGGSKTRATWADIDIAVCTFEKALYPEIVIKPMDNANSSQANMLVNTAIEQCTIDDLGVVVLDELHMIDDEHRGYLMELLATKILSLEHNVQLVGMSATLPNTQLLAKWLDAKYYESKYRPVPIKEYLVLENSVHPVSALSAFSRAASQPRGSSLSSTPSMIIESSTHNELRHPTINAVVALAVDTASQGYGALVFCGGRQACQTTAFLISQAMPACNGELLEQRQDIVHDLRGLSTGLDETLEKTVPRGVAFHRLTTEEREILARAYDTRVISVIVATCSLAAGINLPARRVILNGARMGREPIGPAMLRQMRGRAGRKGKDDFGESFLCCQKADIDDVVQLIEADLPKVGSSMTPERRGIKRALLEVITVRLATHINAIDEYIQRTLLYHTMEKARLKDWVAETIDELQNTAQISVDSMGMYQPTPLSRATVGAGMTPEDGAFVHDELRRALQAFVMDGEMHVIYMFTPVNISNIGEINWRIFRTEIEKLDESGLRVLEFVGINPAFVNRMANSGKQFVEEDAEQMKMARIYRRFYAAFQLRDLCNEVPMHAVARKFEIARGFIQTLAQTCEGFAAGIIQFCEILGWGMLKSVLEHMVDRLKAGARADLLELARIPFVKSRTARIFWENGMRSLRSVAEADARELVPLLLLAQPKRYNVAKAEDERYQQKILLRAEIIVESANRLWTREQQLNIETDL